MRRANETLQNEGQQMEAAQHEAAKSDIPQGFTARVLNTTTAVSVRS